MCPNIIEKKSMGDESNFWLLVRPRFHDRRIWYFFSWTTDVTLFPWSPPFLPPLIHCVCYKVGQEGKGNDVLGESNPITIEKISLDHKFKFNFIVLNFLQEAKHISTQLLPKIQPNLINVTLLNKRLPTIWGHIWPRWRLRIEGHLRVTSHTRLRAHDQYISSTLIGGKGGVGPSLLHTMLEGPTEYVNARWM